MKSVLQFTLLVTADVMNSYIQANQIKCTMYIFQKKTHYSHVYRLNKNKKNTIAFGK